MLDYMKELLMLNGALTKYTCFHVQGLYGGFKL